MTYSRYMKLKIYKNRLTEIRRTYKLAIKDMASILNVSYNAIRYWENGYAGITSEQLDKIEEFFCVPKSYLLGESSDYEIPEDKRKAIENKIKQAIDCNACLDNPSSTFSGDGADKFGENGIYKNNIKQLRKKKNITQFQLASETGIDVRVISYWEHYDRIIDTESLNILSLYFGVALDEI